MWRTPNAILHTVPLPDLGLVFSPPVLAGLRSVLSGMPTDQLSGLIDDVEAAVFDHWNGQPVDPAAEAPFTETPPPAHMFTAVVDNPTNLRRELEGVDPRWRLDVLMAIEDLLSEGRSTPPAC